MCNKVTNLGGKCYPQIVRETQRWCARLIGAVMWQHWNDHILPNGGVWLKACVLNTMGENVKSGDYHHRTYRRQTVIHIYMTSWSTMFYDIITLPLYSINLCAEPILFTIIYP